ncbi:cell surface protein SprA [Chryseobacterium suipulveris]|uniref:Cell surface protein SprA n=1 Tax=Chryseobacterium suipulveris TaxID=2929800 RepID=A0ABY4BTD2_9FLAO|nr:cell surface protein SprA [Chryseobacterium suipulveris]UOE42473.1 cell surface protein SprA [Chryseobacterium suipulveris]
MIFRHKLLTLFFLCFSFVTVFAQVKPSDSASVRQDFSLPDPLHYEAFYDVQSGMYILYPKIGNMVVGSPVSMTSDEYYRYMLNNQLSSYYREKSALNSQSYLKETTAGTKKGFLPSLNIKNKLFESIFGGNKIEIIPQGFASFDLGILYQKIDNPLILPHNRTNFAIDIQQRIQLGLLGKVGENLQLKANYDTQSGFAFENKMNLVWQAKGTWKDLQSKGLQDKTTGGEDKIIKRVEFGNVNMPLSTSLIRGSESLFGLKTEFQLGKTYGTLVFSQQQGESRNIIAQGGGVMNTFKLNAIDYEDNQHYYLGHYFLNNYDRALEYYPQVQSRINITRIEAWVLDQGSGNLQDQKGILGIRDLGEGASGIPDNSQNNLYQSIVALGPDIRNVNTAYNAINRQTFPNANGTPEIYMDGEQFIFNRKARRLSQNEFTFHPQLGYLSLNQRLNDNQLLAVSYSYTLNGESKVYKVGEFSEEGSVLITKVLKPNTMVKTTSPMWDLMMKNIYSLNTNQLSGDGFLLNVYYRDAQSGKVNYLPNTPVQDINLLKLFNWDRLNMNNDLQQNGDILGDGIFDFVPNITVDPANGKVIFTKAKPFGSYLQSKLGSNDPKFVFNDLYDQQKQVASQSNLALRYTMEGRFKGSQGTGISLGAINVPQGSVKVTANGVQLQEGVDYTVDYMLGTVNIINEAVKQSGQAINISMENQLTFNTQRKRFLGLNLERKFNEHLTIGGTVVNYSETPLTQKVNFGQEAVNNTMAGFNILYNNQLPFLTRLTDKIPLINTEAPSNLSFMAEGAYLIPGQNKGIGDQSYIDDFEQTTSKISLKEPAMWSLASKPELNPEPIFSGAELNDNLAHGNGRGLLSWYNIDPRFYGIGGAAPTGINAQAVSNHASRRVEMKELYNSRDFVAGEQLYTNTFDISYFPQERGPYNVNTQIETTQQRWAGLMRPISVSNFTNSNIEYVEFWMMDPYADGKNLGADPKILLHLGNVSEDVLKDGKLTYENGLPTPNVPANTTTTNWGKQPNQFPILYAFSTEGDERTAQDLGYDGLDAAGEADKFGTNFMNPVTNLPDPASDDFVFYLSNKFTGPQASSVAERYKYFRGPEGNSQSNTLEVATQTPDAEDVNRDYNLDQNENYNQYTIKLGQQDMVLGENFIVDVKEVDARFQNGQTGKNKWYLFRIPVTQFDTGANEGGAKDPSILNNVRFARLLLTGFDEASTIRFGTLDLVRSDWRKYTKNIATNLPDQEGTQIVTDQNLDVGSVNLEENGLNQPPYVLPPGIDRQVLSGNAGAQRQNEASLYMKASPLFGDTSRGVFKNVALDMRRYQNMELFVHAEDLKNVNSSAYDPDAKFFIRFGSDATDNYYEYEASLKYTAKNAKSPLEIWPHENMMHLEIQNFVNAKMRRDQEHSNAIDQRIEDVEYGSIDPNKKIYIKGRPSLGNVTTIMLGVRNKNAASTKEIVLWVNEIRLSGIENKGGYAGNASLNFNLGDFALVNANASYSTVGFGGITQKPSERSQATHSAFSINTTVNVDKFLPEKAGMKIPVNYSYTQTIEDPKYNPIDNDVKFEEAPNRDQLKKVARTYTQQRSVGVVNMRKERMNPNKKPKFYDVENVSVTAVYNDDYYRDVYTKKNYRQYLKGYIDYNYSFKPWVLRPFNKVVSDTAKSYKYLRWLKEVNFNPVPTRLSFRTEVDRNYNELEFRNIESILSGNTGQEFDVIRNRNFFFGWQYGLGFNFTKSLKLEINSAMRTLNDNLNPADMTTKSIFSDVFRAGRPVLYNHRVQLNYRFPFEYLPYLDFINAELGYGFTYNWNARSTVMTRFINPDTQKAESLGSIGQNTNNIIGTATVDMPKFFSKFKYFQAINSKMLKRKQEIDSLNNVITQEWQKKNGKRGFRTHKFKNKLTPLQSIAYALTSVKQLDISYNENNGTVLPGLLSAPNFFGYGQTLGGPTAGFLLGSQADYRRTVIERGWISDSHYMNDPYTQMKNRNFLANVQIMPVNDFRIDLNVMKNFTSNFTQGGYNVDADSNPANGFQFSFGNDMITHSKTAWTFRTAFTDGATIYDNMIANARQISQQMGGTLAGDGFTDGHSLANAYVLVPAFQAAVEGKSVSGPITDPKKSGFPLPNWRVTYSGLKNIPLVNSQFSKFDVLHGYTSTYTASGIQSSIDYYNMQHNAAPNRDAFNDFYNPYTYSQVGYVEAFAPLIGADMTLRNNMQFRASYNRDRMFMLGLVNHTLTEDVGKEYIFGFGYILKDFKLKMNFKGKERTIKSDVNFRGDFSLRDSQTRITNILQNDSQVTGGQRMMSIKFSADYSMSQNFNIKLFYDQMLTKYKISTAFPLSTIRAGITATFTFTGAGGGF